MTKTPVAKRLKELRSIHNLSQRKLGIAGGLDPTYANVKMNQYENAKHNPPYWLLKNLAKEFNIPVSFFFETDEEVANVLLNYYKQ